MKTGGYTFVETDIAEIQGIGCKRAVEIMAQHGEIEARFAGIDVGNTFRVPAADNKVDMFFSNREFLARFTSLTLPVQETFIKCVRETTREAECNILHLKIKWSQQKERILRITVHSGNDGDKYSGHIDFDLLS